MSVIDLGEIRDLEPGDPDVSGRVPLPRPRRFAVPAVALICALTLGAAVPAPAPRIRDVWTTDAALDEGMTLTEDSLFVTRRTRTQAVLTAYDLATGATRWAQPLHDDNLSSIDAKDGMLWIAGQPLSVETVGEDGQSSGTRLYPGNLVVLDAATGAERWRTQGEVQRSGPDSALIADRDDSGELRALRLVGTRAGEVRWEQPLTHVLDLQIQLDGDRPARIVTITGNGEIAVYRYADGAPVARRQVAWAGAAQNTVAVVVGDQLVVTWTDRRGATVSAYRLDDLSKPAWTLGTVRSALLTDCGPVLCLSQGAEVTGLDPVTGETRWLLPGQAGIIPVRTDRLLAYSTDEQPTLALVDAGTGRVIGDGGTGWPMHLDDTAHVSVVLRASRTEPGRTVIGRMSLDTGRVTPVGTVESTEGFTCDSSSRFLVCQRPDSVVVTAIG